MILKVNDTEDFNIAMNLNVYYKAGYVEVTVKVWNKKTNTIKTKVFSAVDFAEAVAYYERESQFLIGSN